MSHRVLACRANVGRCLSPHCTPHLEVDVNKSKQERDEARRKYDLLASCCLRMLKAMRGNLKAQVTRIPLSKPVTRCACEGSQNRPQCQAGS